MQELIREIEDALAGPLHGRQWAKDLFWDLLSFDRVAKPVPDEVLPHKDRAGIGEAITWAQLDDIRVGLFRKTSGVWTDEKLDVVAGKIGLVWRHAILLFADADERQWHLVACAPRSEGQAGIGRCLEMSGVSRDSTFIALIAGLSPETQGSQVKTLHELWRRGRPMEDVITKMLYQLPRATRRHINQSGFLEFIRAAAMHPLLRKSEEHELARRIQNGDRDAWRGLVEHNIRLGFWGANRFGRPGADFEQSFQHSMQGIMRAAEKYDPELDTRFSTYAYHWMWQACQREREKNFSVVYLPPHQQKPLRDYIKRRQKQPIQDEPWTEVEWEHERIMRLVKPEHYEWARSPVYQEACSEIEPFKIVQYTVDLDERMAAIKTVLSEAASKEHDIMSHRFGLITGEDLTLEKCGEMYGVSRERIRQIERKQLERLRKFLPVRYPVLFEEFKLAEPVEEQQDEDAVNSDDEPTELEKELERSETKKMRELAKELRQKKRKDAENDGLQTKILRTLDNHPQGLAAEDFCALIKRGITNHPVLSELLKAGCVERVEIVGTTFYRMGKNLS